MGILVRETSFFKVVTRLGQATTNGILQKCILGSQEEAISIKRILFASSAVKLSLTVYSYIILLMRVSELTRVLCPLKTLSRINQMDNISNFIPQYFGQSGTTSVFGTLFPTQSQTTINRSSQRRQLWGLRLINLGRIQISSTFSLLSNAACQMFGSLSFIHISVSIIKLLLNCLRSLTEFLFTLKF